MSDQQLVGGSLRPDGTVRKVRKVKPGYVAQEDQPVYKSLGKLHAEAVAARGVPGLDSSSFAAAKSSEPSKAQLEREAKEKKEAAARAAALKAALEADDFESAVKAAEQAASKAKTEGTGGEAATDPAKRQRNLKKKLDGIRALEDKLAKGEVKEADLQPEQREKLKNKAAVEAELAEITVALAKI